MLFSYTYVPHSMEKMQAFINFIFYDVWCKAPGNGSFRLELFDDNAELKELMEAFYYSDTQGADFFYGHVERIYRLFTALTPPQINQFKQWYRANNDIEKVCANDPAVQIARYQDIGAFHPDLSKQLASFFKGLYSQQLLGLKAVRDKIGRIGDHYQAFMQANRKGICPFCGLVDINGVHDRIREAYDHYLPKALYPFNSINFRNLAPACNKCNSSYKRSKDPVNNASGRRKAFYPYSKDGYNIKTKVDLNTPNIDRLRPEDIQLTFEISDFDEETESWKEVYEIEERYKAKCCSESGGKYWVLQVMDEWSQDGRTPDEFLNALSRQAIEHPLADSNFLKKAFLEGCQRAGLFDDTA